MESKKNHPVKSASQSEAVSRKAGQFDQVKICHVASVDITVKFLLMPQIKFLQGQGYDVSAVCSAGKWINDIEKEGIKVKIIKITRKITPLSDLFTLFQLYLYFKKEK